ncbi:hypothetical protein SAMN05660199_03026 [Klenkia soli]|uniref:Ketoreductase domain-containing protein n=1 Tax=Klenkia soli TaxID=1052260 RepID=A0A1H0PAH3_9ACTN|nr:SDR family oxidoreductase [Klenkia soli]SDP02072.1 hypothetical protein SAMN05660199_03026 [Klenkia soli]
MTGAGVVGTSLAELRRLLTRRTWSGTDRVVVITGGAGGIGSALAARLAGRGASVVVVDRDGERAAAVAAGLPGPGVHTALDGDLTDPAQVEAALAEVDRRHGRVDVLVNNTGMTSAERFGDRSLASIEQEITVNTLSPLYVTRLALPLLRRSVDPRVVTTVSLAGIFPQAETPIYCASKFGLRGAMLSIALDLHAEGVRVGSVLPSATDTPMLRREAVEGGNALQFQGGPPQRPGDVVDAVLSLLDRPRLEAYPRPAESRLVRLSMAFPNLLLTLLPFFAGKGEDGRRAYLEELLHRGEVARDGAGWVLADPTG